MPDSQDPLIPLLRDLTRGMCNDLWVQDAATRIREVVAGAIPCRECRGPDICADAGQCGLSASMEDVAGETTLESVRREAREAALREAMEAVKHIPPCPFDGPHKLKPEDPCPICGDLGTFDQPDNGSPTRCQSAWAAIRALLSSSPPERAVDPGRALARLFKRMWDGEAGRTPKPAIEAMIALGLIEIAPANGFTSLSPLGKAALALAEDER